MAKADVNTVAAHGFEQAATVYEQARPSYPLEIIDLIKSLCDKPDILIDLGAGTGKFTRLLGPVGAKELIAIEPVAAMRENLKNIPIITKIIDGTAEHIPLEDHTVDIIVCAQAFHWFANHRALAEFNRVLKPKGCLVLLWNTSENKGIEWIEKIAAYVDTYKPTEVNRYKSMEWKQAFDNQNYFSPLQQKQYSHVQRITRDLAINRILSTSFIAALPLEKQKQLTDDVRKMLDDTEEIRDVNEFDAHHVTDVYWSSPLQSST